MSRYNFFEVISVTDTSFPSVPQAKFGFLSNGIILLNRGSAAVQYSFDGTTVHGDLNNADESKFLTFRDRVESVIYFKVSGGSEDVRVEVWGGWGNS